MTTLFQYAYSTSYGIDDRSGKERVVESDPEEDILSYIEAPVPVADRKNLKGKVLVSGWTNSPDRTDQLVFDFLNDEESPFAFTDIVAFVKDEKSAKKRLLSRSARYTGLLDKLSFIQSTTPEELNAAIPTVEQLAGVNHWVANTGTADQLSVIKSIAALCEDPEVTVENVSILVENASALAPADIREALKALDDASASCGTKYTVVAVGDVSSNTAEGAAPYGVRDFGTDDGVTIGTFSRDESVRLVTNTMALESGANKALSFLEVDTNCTEARLVKALRESGYSRYQEIDHMIAKGVAGYEEAIATYKQKKYERENPDPEEQARLKAEQDEKDRLSWEQSEKDFEERKKNEIEENARAWAKREYFRKSMGGNMGMTEEEYIESVWERAMFEGDLKYRMMHGGKTDERTELADFLKKQEAKKEAALKRAKAVLEDQLGTKLPEDKGNDKKDD